MLDHARVALNVRPMLYVCCVLRMLVVVACVVIVAVAVVIIAVVVVFLILFCIFCSILNEVTLQS